MNTETTNSTASTVEAPVCTFNGKMTIAASSQKVDAYILSISLMKGDKEEALVRPARVENLNPGGDLVITDLFGILGYSPDVMDANVPYIVRVRAVIGKETSGPFSVTIVKKDGGKIDILNGVVTKEQIDSAETGAAKSLAAETAPIVIPASEPTADTTPELQKPPISESEATFLIRWVKSLLEDVEFVEGFACLTSRRTTTVINQLKGGLKIVQERIAAMKEHHQFDPILLEKIEMLTARLADLDKRVTAETLSYETRKQGRGTKPAAVKEIEPGSPEVEAVTDAPTPEAKAPASEEAKVQISNLEQRLEQVSRQMQQQSAETVQQIGAALAKVQAAEQSAAEAKERAVAEATKAKEDAEAHVKELIHASEKSAGETKKTLAALQKTARRNYLIDVVVSLIVLALIAYMLFVHNPGSQGAVTVERPTTTPDVTTTATTGAAVPIPPASGLQSLVIPPAPALPPGLTSIVISNHVGRDGGVVFGNQTIIYCSSNSPASSASQPSMPETSSRKLTWADAHPATDTVTQKLKGKSAPGILRPWPLVVKPGRDYQIDIPPGTQITWPLDAGATFDICQYVTGGYEVWTAWDPKANDHPNDRYHVRVRLKTGYPATELMLYSSKMD